MSYLIKRNTTYHYNRRTPTLLQPHINTKIIKRSLSKSIYDANLIAKQITVALDKAIMYSKMGVDALLISELLNPYFNTLDIEPSKPKARVEAKEVIKVPSHLSNRLVEAYLSSLSVSAPKMKAYVSRVETLQAILKDNPITPKILDTVSNTLQTKLPKRTIPKYKNIEVSTLLEGTYSEDELNSKDTTNNYLKLLRALLKWGFSREYFSKDYSDIIVLLKDVDKKAKRDTLSEAHIVAVQAKLTPSHSLLFNTLRYSGLRPSELQKAKIHKVDDVLVFDLLDAELKTASSKRIVPIHSKLIPQIQELQEVIASTNNMEPLSRAVTKELRNLGLDNNSTLYSLRHSMITKLIQEGVDTEVVSNLAGHSSNGNKMTMGVYFKGYKVNTLQEAIERL